MTDRTRWLVTVAVALAVVAPAVLPSASDGFPISTYPMFTSERGQVMALDTVVLVDGDQRQRLSPVAIGGTDEIVLAAVTVTNAIRGGAETLARLCDEVADRIDGPGTIEIVTETHDTVALLQDDAEPLEIRVHHRCPADP
jgi:hypothetical protein